MPNSDKNERRDIASRNTKWAHIVAKKLAKSKITPNQISLLSTLFSAIGGASLLLSLLYPPFYLYIAFIIYILCIQLRLLCNLFDGMVAVEGGKKTPNGDLFNDIPDRFSDIFLIIPIGYLIGGYGIELAWTAAILAVMTAYFRWIGAYKTENHFFVGPMAKQHRMALLTVMSAICIVTIPFGYYKLVILITLIIMNIGLIMTLIHRIKLITQSKS